MYLRSYGDNEHWVLVGGTHNLNVADISPRGSKVANATSGVVLWPRLVPPKNQVCFTCKGCGADAVASGARKDGTPDFCSVLCKVRRGILQPHSSILGRVVTEKDSPNRVT